MADTTVVFYGIKLEVSDDDLDELESRSHPMQIAARNSGLENYWGIFAAPNERYLLFVGKLLGKIGVEDRMEIEIEGDDFAKTAKVIGEKLSESGLFGTATLYVEYQPDV